MEKKTMPLDILEKPKTLGTVANAAYRDFIEGLSNVEKWHRRTESIRKVGAELARILQEDAQSLYTPEMLLILRQSLQGFGIEISAREERVLSAAQVRRSGITVPRYAAERLSRLWQSIARKLLRFDWPEGEEWYLRREEIEPHRQFCRMLQG